MNVLIDTHILIWALNDDDKLSKKARDILLDKNNIIFYSPISIWEIELKHSIHPGDITYDGKKVYEFANAGGYIECPLFASHVIILKNIVRDDKKEHKDPFDNVLLSQAMANDFYFMTHDRLFDGDGYQNVILV